MAWITQPPSVVKKTGREHRLLAPYFNDSLPHARSGDPLMFSQNALIYSCRADLFLALPRATQGGRLASSRITCTIRCRTPEVEPHRSFPTDLFLPIYS